jgi:hypothetical protein
MDYATGETFKLAVGKPGLPFVHVRINGEDVELVLDLGNMTGLAISPALAQRLRLPSTGEWTSYDSAGSARGRHQVFSAHTVAAFGRTWTNVRVYETADDRLPGLIGPCFLQGRRFTVDYATGTIAVTDRPSPANDTRGAAIPLVPSQALPGLLVAEGRVNGTQVLMELDSGKTRTCVDPKLIEAAKLPATGHGYRIDRLELGPRSFAVPHAKKVSFSGISRGLANPILVGVGSDVLSQMVFTVDYRGQVLIIDDSLNRQR